jgi:hypothetical protein
MAIAVIEVIPHQTIPPSLALGGLSILTGIVKCVFKGEATGGVTRDTISFTVGRVNLGTGAHPPVASCIASLASFAYDGVVNDALWAVDDAHVATFTNEDSGSGTADLQVNVNLAVRGGNGLILRINYSVFYFPA